MLQKYIFFIFSEWENILIFKQNLIENQHWKRLVPASFCTFWTWMHFLLESVICSFQGLHLQGNSGAMFDFVSHSTVSPGHCTGEKANKYFAVITTLLLLFFTKILYCTCQKSRISNRVISKVSIIISKHFNTLSIQPSIFHCHIRCAEQFYWSHIWLLQRIIPGVLCALEIGDFTGSLVPSSVISWEWAGLLRKPCEKNIVYAYVFEKYQRQKEASIWRTAFCNFEKWSSRTKVPFLIFLFGYG